ncbi:MAG: type III-A CRISPR-associated protein Cas10/Csm1 [Atribacterota bacterium]
MTEEQVLFAAFMHDLGKLLERSRELTLAPDLAREGTYAHAKHSAQFVRAVRESILFDGYDLQGSYVKAQCSEEMERTVLVHHEPENLVGYLIQLADWIQSAERQKKEERSGEQYFDENLVSPVTWVDEKAERLFFSLEAMTAKNLIPQPKDKVRRGREAYRSLYRGFLERLRLVKDFEQLLSLAEVYLSAVPAQTGSYEGDISLFDHLRLVAGLAQILYRDVQNGILSEGEVKMLRESILEGRNDHVSMQKRLFWLWRGDLSGIQKFIFTVPSDQAVRMIKGRSVYLDLLMRYVVKYLLRELKLSSACVIYLGGGNAEVLLPFCEESILTEIRKRVCSLFFHFHQSELYLAMEWVPVSLAELFEFMGVRSRLQERIETRKRQKFLELGEETLFQWCFSSEKVVIREGEGCKRCGRKREWDSLCPACASFVEFTDTLKKAQYLIEEEIKPLARFPQTVWEMFQGFGFRIAFGSEVSSSGRIYTLGDVNLDIGKGCLADGFLPGSFRLPDATFENISETSVQDQHGDPALGYLKMDVDNLGAIFSTLAKKGRERASALSFYRAFSRRLELFFGVYLVLLIRERVEKKFFYPVFAGGDDLFVIGGWKEVVKLAEEIHQEFAKFTGSSQYLTLSGGLSFVPPKFPAIRAAQMVEEALEEAKSTYYPQDKGNEDWIKKDKVGIFEEVLSWREYAGAFEIYQDLEKRVLAKDVPRAIFQKIERSLYGFQVILNDSLKGVLRFPRVWRFLYFLRDHKEIAERMEGILLGNVLQREEIRNPRLVLVANRLAAMATRVKKED